MIARMLVGIALTYLASEAYARYATPQQKRAWEDLVGMHHGEAGAIMACVGTVARSPTLTALGIGLMLHDRKDYRKWFAWLQEIISTAR